LALNNAPFIQTPPHSTNVFVGADVTFSVAAGGSQPLRYQWRFNGRNILNETNTSLALNNVQLTAAGNYSVFVSNLVGSVLSDIASLNVIVPPAITLEAIDPVAAESGADTGTIRVSRTGDPSLPLTVHYLVAGSATPVNDYLALSGAVTFAPATSSTNITIVALDDANIEAAENVVLTLTSGADYVIGSPNS